MVTRRLFNSTPSASFLRSLKRRIAVVLGCLGLGAAFIVCRLTYLHVLNQDFLKAQGDARSIHKVAIPAYRGMITDRRGVPLAISTPTDTVWIDPSRFEASDAQLNELAFLVDLEPRGIRERLKSPPSRNFMYIKRHCPPEVGQKIKELKIRGLHIQREFKRYSPAGPAMAQVIGFTDIDDVGQAGMELSFNEWLKPTPGKKFVLEDLYGHWIEDVNIIQLPKHGQTLELSIDSRLQTHAYLLLQQALEKHQAKSATIACIDIPTGEVLVIVSAPSFNLNNPKERNGPNVRSRALTDQYEPGSTLKAFSLASALEATHYRGDDYIDTSPGYMQVGSRVVRDISNNGRLQVKDILSRSSNIGVSKLVLAAPKGYLFKTLSAFGFGESLYTGFPGENSGYLSKENIRDDFSYMTLAFGYAMTATPLQIAHAYATLGSRGIKRPVSLLHNNQDLPASERVISEKVANDILDMLYRVTANQGGSGLRAKIEGYNTAGKTGTTRVVGKGGYDPNRHISFFAGVTPLDNPRLATVVVIEEPNEANYYGGLVCAPVYRDFVERAMQLLNVPPDNAGNRVVVAKHKKVQLASKD